jgi:cytochrome P450
MSAEGSNQAAAGQSILSAAQSRDPYPLYVELRRSEPLSQQALPGVWSLSRYDDVVAVLQGDGYFSSRIMAPADPVLLGADGVRHDAMRAWVGHAFAQISLPNIESAAAAIAVRLLERLGKLDEFDAVEKFCTPLPVEVIALVLGMGDERLDDFTRWSNAVVALGTGAADPAAVGALQEAEQELEAFLAAQIRRRKRQPGADLISLLLATEPAGRCATLEELVSVIKLVLIAGNETTRNLIANAVVAVLSRPALRAEVRQRPSLIPTVLEETLRHESPVQFVYRTAVQDVQIAGGRVPAGAPVMAMLGSANRDERRFPHPERFDLERPPRRHLAFGRGPHSCLGAQLARAEARAALAAFVAIPTLGLVSRGEQVAWKTSLQLRGPARLPVRLGKPERGIRNG